MEILSAIPKNNPHQNLLISEFPRAAKEALSLFSLSWRSQLAKAPRGEGQPVLTIPGFAGADGSMAMLRQFLNRTGFNAYPWLLGRNIPDGRQTQLDDVLAYCEKREAQLVDRMQEIKNETGKKVSLVGWSMGGVFANALAQTHPDLVEQSITLGAPVGNPKETSTWNLLKSLNFSKCPDGDQNVDAWMVRRNQLADRQVRSTAIYSDLDGVVFEAAAIIENEKFVQNIKVQSSHVGFTHNPIVYWVIAERLAQDPANWKAFDISMQPTRIQRCFDQVYY